MKILIVGNGGREHAIAWKLSESPRVKRIYCAPGNGGTSMENKCENVNISTKEEMLNFALTNSIDLTVVGPEEFLCNGIVDLFMENGLKIFGPNKRSAILEGSKSFAKSFMQKYGVKTADYVTFSSVDEALKYAEKAKYPLVIKADGLAAGKGVVVANSMEEGVEAIKKFMVKDILEGAGKEIIIEEFIEGVEASILAITDGNTIKPFISSKDHKAIYNGNKGPNTGGMGAIAPNPHCTEYILRTFKRDIMEPTLKGLKEEKLGFSGIIFFGLIINEGGVYLLEYNVRMGDPETQVVLPLLEGSLLDLIEGALEGTLNHREIKFKDKVACCVIGASQGYPERYSTGEIIEGYNQAKEKIFYGGVSREKEKLVTSGGRVFGITALGDSIEEASRKAYLDLSKVKFKGIYYRTDIGK